MEKIIKLVIFVVALKIAAAQYLCDFANSNFCSLRNQTISSTAPFSVTRNASYPLTAVVINEATMPKIPQTIFANYPTVNFFSTSNNGINELTPFVNCPNLATIMIRNDKVSSIPASVFKACFNLISLQLMNHTLSSSSIDANAFDGLRNLTVLVLTFNSITSLNSNWFIFPKLTYLDLSYNRIENLDENVFRQLPSLNILYLQYNQISFLPPNLLSFLSKPLSTFIVTFNRLTGSVKSVGAAFSDFSDNFIISFNITVGEETLHLSNNSIRRLNCPSNTNLTVKRLYASENALTNFLCIRDMRNLTDMNVTTNGLRTTQAAFKNLKNLRFLAIFNQKKFPIARLTAFANMTSLMTLYVDGFKSYRTVKQTIPNLNILSLSTRGWTCAKTQNVTNTLTEQKVRMLYNKFNDRFICNITQPRF